MDIIRLGDSITHGGTVIEAFSQTDLNGNRCQGLQMKLISCSALVVLSVCLPMLASAALHQFADYRDFYQSLGNNVFEGPGTALVMPCAESPRHCIWVTSMRQAVRRYDQAQWTTPDGLTMDPAKGYPKNTYLRAEQENNPNGLQVDYLMPDGQTRVVRYLLRFVTQGDPFLFEAVRQ